MPVTLAQAKLNTQDAIDLKVIDEFRKESWLLDNMVFDDVVNPAGGGSTLTYGYTRLVTQPTAAFRAINAEYAPSEVTRQRYTTDLHPLGGSFQIDRVLAKVGAAASGEVALQMSQKIKAARTKFQEAVILGDSATDANSFDGLSKALAGSSTEVAAGAADWSTVADRTAGVNALKLLRKLIAKLDSTPSAFLMNADALAAIETIADYVSQLSNIDAFGQTVTAWRGIPLINLGEKSGTSDPIIPTQTAAGSEGKTDIYAVRLGLDGFHGLSVSGGQLVSQYMPDFSTPGAVKTGEVEMGPVGVALKATKAAAVLRGVKVA